MNFRILFFFGCFTFSAFSAEVIPPPPSQYFNDYAGITHASVAAQLNTQLEQFERDTSNQIVIAIYPTMQTDSSIEDYTVRVAQSWHVGQKKKDNGAILFVFVREHKMYIQVGYGLEGALPDALCKQIIDQEIKPYFKAGDFDRGLESGVAAIISATKGEYQGSGRTDADSTQPGIAPLSLIILLIILFILLRIFRSSGTVFYGGGYSSWGGGGWGSGGGGGFSGGGGSFGGGGAGGSW